MADVGVAEVKRRCGPASLVGPSSEATAAGIGPGACALDRAFRQPVNTVLYTYKRRSVPRSRQRMASQMASLWRCTPFDGKVTPGSVLRTYLPYPCG